jgi:predicted CoA-substrate-specific enzyme activase
LEKKMLYAGIDAGSRAVKIVLIDQDQTIIHTGLVDQGIEQSSLAERLLDRMLLETGNERKEIHRLVATGYGRDALDFTDTAITEITCHARGVSRLHPGVRTVIDIGGQDSKVIRLEDSGRVRDFVMNDRCAAGTGRFLEVVAGRLEMGLQEIGSYAEKAEKPSDISSMCVVFAESEIIGLLAAGEKPESIIAGVQNSIARRIASMAGRNVKCPVYFTGGVAKISGMERVLQQTLGYPVQTAESPQFTGAFGAALLAMENG